ncbi:MAG TPA: peptide chain release factor N(5)-glutamine methyltransferase [Euzebyales bacterium]|nr:peptide chain release factor N(5)-glutamine methyltransferase [Euzebyales bacterium]
MIVAPPTVAAALDEITGRLADAGIDSPRTEARWLVRHVLGWSAAELVRRSADVLDADKAAALDRLVDRRASREPLQLVFGATGFRAHDLMLRPGVFVPRPETELLVELALELLPTGAIVVEPCTGSGAVACAIAVERPDVQVIATDVDDAAVALAVDNAARLGVDVDVRPGDLLEPVPDALQGTVDVLISNPPYLAEDELADVPPEVADWDPSTALIAGPTGHEVSDRLIALAMEWLRPGGWLLLELDERRVGQAADHAQAAGLSAVGALADLTGRLRFVRARRP